jgi:hypothetical protein
VREMKDASTEIDAKFTVWGGDGRPSG